MNWKKFWTIVGSVLVLFFVFSQPVQAAGVVDQIIVQLQSAGESVVTFLGSVFG